jgi:tetratricopeptide (TPR) repeat protein
MRVTPIGSCRIVDPLRRASKVHPIKLGMSGVYGYTHSSAEALQLIRYLLEGISPGPPELLPLICRSAGAVKQRPRNLSDLYLVELSSAKVISVADTILQQNYLKSHLADFFDDHGRSRKFWLFARGARREALHNWLAREPAFLKQPEEYRKVLANVTMRTVTLDELIEDMREIVGRLLRVVFITHCNARLPSGEMLQGRSQFIELVKVAGATVGCPVYDPTHLMSKVGQDKAMARGSTALAHYTRDFETLLYEDWVDAFGLPHATRKGNQGLLAGALLPHKVYSEALADIRSYLHSHSWRSALDSAEGVLRRGVATADVLQACAVSAEALDQDGEARRYATSLLQFGDHAAEACALLAKLDEKAGATDSAIDWYLRSLLIDPHCLGRPAQIVKLLVHSTRNRSLDDLFGEVELTANALRSIIAEARKSGLVAIAAQAVNRLATHNRSEARKLADEVAKEWLIAIADDALEDPNDWIEALHCIARLNSEARGFCRTLEKQRRKLAREAFKRHDLEETIRSGTMALAAGSGNVQLCALVGRAHFDSGNYAVARAFFGRALEASPIDAKLLLRRARASFLAGDLIDAQGRYAQLRVTANATSKMMLEADRRLATLPNLMLRQAALAVGADDIGRAWSLTEAALLRAPDTGAARELQRRAAAKLRRQLMESRVGIPAGVLQLARKVLGNDNVDSKVKISIARAIGAVDSADDALLAWERLVEARSAA